MSNKKAVKPGWNIPAFKYDSARHLLIPEEANLLVDGHNRIHNMDVVRGTQDRVVISDHKITIELRDTALDDASASSAAFHPFRAYIVPLADCNFSSDFGRCVQVRAGLVQYRDEYYLGSYISGIDCTFADGPLTRFIRDPIYPVLAGTDGVVGTTGGGLGQDFTSTSTGSGVARTTVYVSNTGDFTDSGFAQFVFNADTDADGYNFAAIWIEITEGDDSNPPTFAIKARHFAYNAGGTGRTGPPWPDVADTDQLVIPLALMEFTAGQIENLCSGHVLNYNTNNSQGFVFRGDWDATRYFHEGDVVYHELTLGDYVYSHWRCVFPHRNQEPVDLTHTYWHEMDSLYAPP